MIKKTANVSGCKVTLESEGDWSGCWIESGKYSASLEALLDTGCLSDDCYRAEFRLGKGTIAAIERWALSNGY